MKANKFFFTLAVLFLFCLFFFFFVFGVARAQAQPLPINDQIEVLRPNGIQPLGIENVKLLSNIRESQRLLPLGIELRINDRGLLLNNRNLKSIRTLRIPLKQTKVLLLDNHLEAQNLRLLNGILGEQNRLLELGALKLNDEKLLLSELNGRSLRLLRDNLEV